MAFINDKWKLHNGVLQQFVQPKGEKNCMRIFKRIAYSFRYLDIIKANWSPKICLFEKIEAVTRINDAKHDIYDRVLTFEAENFHSRESKTILSFVLKYLRTFKRLCLAKQITTYLC